ncbi:hypothetical protein LARI1_G009222 [Lachnellula arida]|uniref:Uncharacterized protein n=1 Tax=Lachnellula arida TaxID=1316785 RepID=A0A8T9B1E9_9HELO|nr:hypothetical protein LARI1_G009222 [Lachnellula arida]
MHSILPTSKPQLTPSTLGKSIFSTSGNENSQYASLIPFIQRLICTGLDNNLNIEKFFGSGGSSGIGTMHRNERKNYLKAAKRSWLEVKLAYDIGSEETVPFLVPLRGATEKEITDAGLDWSEWLAMQDWILGPRRPHSLDVHGVERMPR